VASPRAVDWLGELADAATAARLAVFYDVDNASKSDDVDFFRQMAKRTGGPILELGCGTGRIALPLAADGHRVVGVDRSPAQLARAKQKAAAAGVRLELVVADMREFALPEPFRLIIIAFNTFLLLSPDERRVCLTRVREHLARDGIFVLDVFQPNPDVIAAKQGAIVHEWTRTDSETGRTVVKSQCSEADVDGVETTHLYDEIDTGGAVRRYVRTFRLHYVYRRELELLLAGAGFEVEAVYGSYELEPVTPRAPKLLAVARRRERSAIDRRRA
jgi:SAM-dependent methyltransferase